ncbi:hypothetical protein ACYSNU_16725 [Enterococcus sp. LJL120]
MKTLEQIEKILNDKLAVNQQEIQEYQEKIDEASKSVKKANDDLLASENEVNVDNYNLAKDRIWSSNHAKELYQKQKEKLAGEPLVTKTEYNQLLSEVTQAADAALEEQNTRAADLIAELRNISEESSCIFQQANQLLHRLQREVYKEPEGKLQLDNGNTTWSADKTYKKDVTVHAFYNNKVKGSPLAKRSGEQEQPSSFKYWG